MQIRHSATQPLAHHNVLNVPVITIRTANELAVSGAVNLPDVGQYLQNHTHSFALQQCCLAAADWLRRTGLL